MFYILDKSDKTIFIVGETTDPFTIQAEPKCLQGRLRGDTPYCTCRFNCNIIVLTVISMDT